VVRAKQTVLEITQANVDRLLKNEDDRRVAEKADELAGPAGVTASGQKQTFHSCGPGAPQTRWRSTHY